MDDVRVEEAENLLGGLGIDADVYPLGEMLFTFKYMLKDHLPGLWEMIEADEENET